MGWCCGPKLSKKLFTLSTNAAERKYHHVLSRFDLGTTRELLPGWFDLAGGSQYNRRDF